jgi:hypothetical protein
VKIMGGEIMSSNLKAGMGDPYWYEWSVGLLYVLDMLIPEKNIKHVILQCSKMQGLDDVVVVRDDGHIEGVQIKHTRENDTITFSDVTSGGLIKSMSDDWERAMKQGYTHCTAILFSNRSIGTRQSTSKNGTKLPSLHDFWSSLQEQINGVTTIDEFSFEADWNGAWKNLLNELEGLSNEKKLKFLKDLRLVANQKDLSEIYISIVEKLKQCFRVDERTATQLHQKLTYALMEWTTTERKREEITKEDLLHALSLSGDKVIGQHDLPICQPFFPSRVEFSNILEPILAKRESSIVFLSGGPGSGKTNIINYLSNKTDSVITLRFHAFKPLSPEDEYLTADKGISDPRALWGNLLIGLREIYIQYGKMSSHNVPPTIELFESVEALRSEVLRLSHELADLTARTTVIVIDGIDHAARSGEPNTFLSTLVPPESIPGRVCFLIAGQPVSEYGDYPYFLADSSRVLTVDVPNITENDVMQLYDSSNSKIPVDGRDAAIRLIYRLSAGNTLSAVFAVQEARRNESVDELEKQLEEKHLARGIESYYNYIWTSTIASIPSDLSFIDMMLAGTLTLFNKPIKPTLLSSICPDAGFSQLAWKRLLQKLYPIVVKTTDEAYIVFHNDVRIYLGRYLRTDPGILSDVSNRLADFLLSGEGDIRTKHELIFDFLQNANRNQELIDVYSRQYVTEALDIKRPMIEIMTQLESTLNSLKQLSDFEKVLSLSCAVATMHQFNQSLQWIDQQYSGEVELPAALVSERKVIKREFLTVDILFNMLGDTMLLIQHGEILRAECNIKRWLGTLDTEAIAEILELNSGDEDTEGFEEDLASMLELWGRVSQHTGVYFSLKNHDDNCSDKIKRLEANFAKGWLDEGKNFLDIERINCTLGLLNIYYRNDLNDYLMSIVASENAEVNMFLINCGIKDQYPNNLKLQLTIWAIQHDLEELCSDWISEIKSEQFSYIEKEDFDSSKPLFPYYCKIVYVVSYSETINLDETTNSCLHSYKGGNFTPSDRGYYAAVQFIKTSASLGKLNCTLNNGNAPSLTSTDFSSIIEILLNYNDWRNRFEVNGFEVETNLLNAVIRMYPRLDAEFKKQIDLTFSNRAKDFENIAHLDIYWNHLNKKTSHIDLLTELFDKWMEPQGYVWKAELHEINSIALDFIEKASKLGWTDRVAETQKLLNSRIVGYVGRKEYSLYSLLNWYHRISSFQDSHWRTAGVTLLNISRIASQTGDNRASVYIEASVAESAGRMGADELWKFANLTDHWNFEWLQAIFDGVIAALEYNEFTQNQLHEIWGVATSIFTISEYAPKYDARNKINRIYIADIKDAIILAADRLGLHNTIKSMQESDPVAFSQTRTDVRNSYRIPERWYDKKHEYNEKLVNIFCDDIKELSCKDAFSALQERYEQKESFRWDMVLPFVNKVEQDFGEDILSYLPTIFEMLMRRYDAYFWEWDGANRLFEVLFKYFNDEQLSTALNDIVEKHINYNRNRYEVNLYGLNTDLEYFSLFYYERLPEEANLSGFSELARMHMDWITGNQIIPMEFKYTFKPEVTARDWNDFCRKLIDTMHRKI